ncbi:DUF1499 domain-containing protein [Arhodomonas sp. SL1]|uniref:DUF1499 domain-containing protein n=1 Tax=Arhodomonas sp. SL1 TaxID=3425691 RepID=UPI003F8826C0
MNKETRPHRLSGAMAALALAAFVLSALLMGAAGPAYRFDFASLGTAFEALRYGTYGAITAVGLGLITLIVAVWGRRLRPALVGGLVILGAIALVVTPYLHWQRAQSVPPIHDITTDTADPPAFRALATARDKAPNAVSYPGGRTARLQRQAYPGIDPLRLNAPRARVREAAVAEVRDRGWELAAVTDDAIEATATTFWFGFRDDVVIRLRDTGNSVRVDMRSASRIGTSDVGTNAARIRSYLEALRHRVTAR